MPNSPLITIGITCFNAEDTIRRALHSAINQNWLNTEIIIVDDASTDNSISEIDKMILETKNISLIRLDENRGVAFARNIIIDEAKGEFITFFDDDDVSLECRLSRQIQLILEFEKNKNTKLIACYGSREMIAKNGTRSFASAIGTRDIPPEGEMVAMHLLCGEYYPGYRFGMVGTGTLMARTAVYRSVGDFDEQFRRFEDRDWAIRLAFKGGVFIGCREPLINQYITKTEEKSEQVSLKYAILLRKKYKPYLKNKNSYIYALLNAYLKHEYISGHILRSKFILLVLFIYRPKSVFKKWLKAKG